MWLINTTTYTLENILYPSEYAILSHTWDDDEVTFQDIKDLQIASKKKGWVKIQQTCLLAAAGGIKYAWVDTCCIDKSSSAELSEAINSMFKWYKESSACFVWLSDLKIPPPGTLVDSDARAQLHQGLSKCRWFTRGWTLQELIAPTNMIFYDHKWTRFGTKDSLLDELAGITSIDSRILSHDVQLSTVPVARRMAWAATRLTTRIEDRAYSLLGLFDVNMAMIYGEGEKAFIRLQEAIALTSNDLSLFAWSGTPFQYRPGARPRLFYGMLAQDPSQFSTCLDLVNTNNPLNYHVRAFSIANQGLEFLACLGMDPSNGDYVMDLHCGHRVYSKRTHGTRVAIRLMKTPQGFIRYTTRTFVIHFDSPLFEAHFTWDPFPRLVNIPKHISEANSHLFSSQFRNSFRFWTSSNIADWDCLATIADPGQPAAKIDRDGSEPNFWDPCRRVFFTESHPDFVGLLYISVFRKDAETPLPAAVLLCGFQPVVGSEVSALSPWVQLLGQRGWSSPTPAVSGPLRLDFPIDTRHDMHYSRFLTRVSSQARTRLTSIGERPSWPLDMQTSQLENLETGLNMSASVSRVGSGDKLVHDVSILITDMSAKEPLQSAGVRPISQGKDAQYDGICI